MADEVGKRLREKIASMTTRDWLVRVSELGQAVESRDRVIAEQRGTIARLREIVDELRAKVAMLEAGEAQSGAPKKSRSTPRRRPDPAGDTSR